MVRKILQIIPTLDRSGAEKQLVLLATHLPRAEFDVHVCALTRGGPLETTLRNAGIPITVIGKTWKIDPAAYLHLTRFIKQLKPDLVQTWLFAANCYGRTAAMQAGVRQILASERCVDRWKHWHELAIDRRLARYTRRIVVNASGIRDFYVRHGLPAEKFVVIPNAVEPCGASRLNRSELLTQLNLPAEARLIGAIGRLWPQKRIKDLIWATDLLHVIRNDVHFVIIGDGPQRDRLARYAKLCHIEDHVHFLGHRSDVDQLLPHLDLVWLGSSYEGLPNAVMEALAAAVPVVATDIPGIRELVVPGQSGYLVRVGDRAAFAKCANKILDDPDLRSRLGQFGRDQMIADFSVDRMIDRFRQLYLELLS